MKKIFSILLTVILSLGMTAAVYAIEPPDIYVELPASEFGYDVIDSVTSAFGDMEVPGEIPMFVIGDVDAKGDTVEVPVYLTGIPKGLDNVMSIDLKYTYDTKVLEYVSVTKGTTVGSFFSASAGSVHWADSTDIETDEALVNESTIGKDKPLFTLNFRVLKNRPKPTDIVITRTKLTGGAMAEGKVFELVVPAADSYVARGGRISFGYNFDEKHSAYGVGGYRAVVITIKDGGVPYVDGKPALKIDNGVYVIMTNAEDPEITVNEEETAQLAVKGRLHRPDKVTALDALIALNASNNVIADHFNNDANTYILADVDADFEITADDALAINRLSHGQTVVFEQLK